MGDRLSVELHGELTEIRGLAARVEEFGARHQMAEALIGHINLALDELLTNTISYGFDDGRPHRIRVTLNLQDGDLAIEIADDGKPFDPFATADPDLTLPVESRPIGGLGIFFVRKLMDQVDYRRVNGENRILLIKKTKNAGDYSGFQ